MFGFSTLAAHLFQGSIGRTWNCVTNLTNLLWEKFNHTSKQTIMPRSRRRHHSRSKSRSRSHSHDRDRDPKRRKIDAVDSPTHRRSVSCEPQSPLSPNKVPEKVIDEKEEKELNVTMEEKVNQDDNNKTPDVDVIAENKPLKKQQIEEKLKITPTKTLSPKHMQKKLESAKKREEKQKEREEREKKKQEEREKLQQEKEKARKEREELKNKKLEEKAMKEEQKRKEREEKEAKRKEKEEKEEAKRKERENEKLKKQQELEEKNREKKKLEEKKQKAAQAFANFFVPKKSEKTDEDVEEDKGSKMKMFMPFEVKSDMRLAPLTRRNLSGEEKDKLMKLVREDDEGTNYLDELKGGKFEVRRYPKTWTFEEDDDDVVIVEDFGETICEEKKKMKMRVKLLKFHENKRPPYYGTWRKTSASVGPRRPFAEDKKYFDYEVESDDDWEEEEQGESLNGSDDEEKENDDDYEVDNEFFVPHGHLSDDEVDDEEMSKLSPESHKQKLKLLKDEFDQDMRTKTNRMKPRSIGCIWYNKKGDNVDEAIDRHLRPLAIITNGRVFIEKRKDFLGSTKKSSVKELRDDLIPLFLKVIHHNSNKQGVVVAEFMNNMGPMIELGKTHLIRSLKNYAEWKKCSDEGPMLNKMCWCVKEDLRKKYNV